LPHTDFESRESFDAALVDLIMGFSPDLTVLAGFMRILTPVFTDNIAAINIHPSLLPLFKGKDGIKESFESGMKVGGGSYHSLIPKAAEHWGLSVDMNLDGENVADAIAEGKLVVAIMSKGHFTKSGHFIVLRGITADGKVLVADPASLKRSNQEWDLSLILEEARKRVGAGGPFWAISN
jgi:hypothetical protein